MVVAVEVKTGSAGLEHFTDAKVEALRTAMRLMKPAPRRLDLITVAMSPERVTVRWYRHAG